MKVEKKELIQIKKELKKEQRDIKISQFLRNRMAVMGMIVTIFLLLIAIFAPVIARDPLAMEVSERLQAPSAKHWFGTDAYGRDLFSRIIYGTRVSMTVGFSVSGIAFIGGMILGLYAAYYKPLDNVLMRICDGLMAIPSILLAITLMAVLGGSIRNVILSLAVVYMPAVARIVRSQALIVKEQTYVEAMRVLGAKDARIIWGHMASNVLSPVIVQITYCFANAIIVEAALSFLGAGVPAPAPSWGNILYEGKTVIWTSWWMVVFPAFFTIASVLGLNLFGDGLRDLIDPLSN